jgi:hypothetical protein
MPDPVFIKIGMYIMTLEPISAVYFINSSHQYVYSLSLLGNGSVRNITATTNTHATIEVLLDASLSMWSVSLSRKPGD